MSVLRAGLSVVIAVAAVVSSQPITMLGQAADIDPRDRPERVLFIGNSHTARNGGLDWQVANFLAAADPSLGFRRWTMTQSGATLADHYANGAVDRIRLGDYDAVVLQGHLPASPDGTSASFILHARLLHAAVARSGARTVFFMTWPQARLDEVDLEQIVEAHRQIADELDVDVAPAAVAMDMARAERPELALIGEDGVHATWEGAYLAAAVVYATLFDESPVGLPYSFGVSDEDAAFLQRIAWEAVDAWRSDGRPRLPPDPIIRG